MKNEAPKPEPVAEQKPQVNLRTLKQVSIGGCVLAQGKVFSATKEKADELINANVAEQIF